MFEWNTKRSSFKRILVGMLTIMDELRMEDRFDLEAFEIAHKHLNYIAGGEYNINVVDRKSRNNLQEPKSRANPNHIPTTFRRVGTTFQTVGIKFQDLGVTFQHIPEWNASHP